MKIKRGDQVVVISGINAGDQPHRVTEVLDGGERVMVEGTNLVFKHVKRGNPKAPQGGRLRKEMPLHASKVMFYCDQCKKGVRIGYRFTAEGAKERFCRKCSTTVGQVAPARKAHAAK